VAYEVPSWWPDLFSYNPPPDFGMEKKICWETADTHYMTDPTTPKWRVDTATLENPFYESGGAKSFKEHECAVYDQPGYARDDEVYERIIGCTYAIVNEKVIGRVLWSRQCIVQDEEIYSSYQYILTRV
jgi:hypothetical protein